MRKVTCTLSSHSRQSPVWFRDLRNAVRTLGCTENQQSLSYGVYVLNGRSTCSSSKHLGGGVSKEVTPGIDLGSVVWVIVNSRPGIWPGLVSSELFGEGEVESLYTSGETKCLVRIPETPKGRCDEQRGTMSVSVCDSVESHCTLWNLNSLSWWCPVR